MGGIILYTLVVMVLSNENYKYWQTLTKGAAPEWFTGEPSVQNQYYKGGLEYLPSRVPDYGFMERRGTDVIPANTDTKIENNKKEKGITSLDVSINTPDKVELPLIYYKGYKAELNSKEIVIEQSDRGLIQIPINESGSIKIYYAETAVQQVSWYITLISILAFCIFLYRTTRKNE